MFFLLTAPKLKIFFSLSYFWMTSQIGWFSQNDTYVDEIASLFNRTIRNMVLISCVLSFMSHMVCVMIFQESIVQHDQIKEEKKPIAPKYVDLKWLIFICLFQSVRHLATSYFAKAFYKTTNGFVFELLSLSVHNLDIINTMGSITNSNLSCICMQH